MDVLIALLLAVVVLVVIVRSVLIVRVGTVAIVERLGRFSHVAEPGVRILVPLVDRVRNRLVTREQELVLEDEPLVASDSYIVHADVRASVMVVDPVRAAYEVDDPQAAARRAIVEQLRECIGTVSSTEAIERGATLVADLRMHVDPLVRDWGVRINSMDGAISRPPG